ncbi:hypothetical protein Pve01_57330 [Planomonospora venezuelensis]|nr:hypothetical protein Pve01_57330 [Planomonospora venezuelensis]
MIAALVALGAMTAALLPRTPVPRAATTAGTTSLAITACHPLLGRHGETTLWILAEALPLLALALLAARHAPAPRTAISTGLPAAAVALILIRTLWPGEPSLTVTACAAWSLPAIAATGTGLYMRSLDTTRHRAVADAKRAQRLALARDLHDYVAHDISGILVQAQAARLAPGPLPPTVADALRRIEEAGQRAMAAMDRTVEMLHDRPGTHDDHHLPGTESLENLVSGFSPPANLAMTPGLDLPRETSATVYRVVTEALTNVHRHARQATRVDVTVTREGATVRVRITDDGGGFSETTGRGGYGLAGLTERAELLGGSLSAGPTPGGWHVTAVLPAETTTTAEAET